MRKAWKRMLALVVALVMVVSTFHVVPAFGDVGEYGDSPGLSGVATFTVQVLSPSAAPGQYVDVALVVPRNITGIYTLGLAVEYDSSILQSISVTQGNLMNLSASALGDNNPIQLNFYSANPLERTRGTGQLAVIRFRIHDNAASGATPLAVTPTHAYDVHNGHLHCMLSLSHGPLVNIAQGAVNVCPSYCECLSCANESVVPNFVRALGLAPTRVTLRQARSGDWGLPTTIGILTTPAGSSAIASISWGPPKLLELWNGVPVYEFIGTVILPDGVTNSNGASLTTRTGVFVERCPGCDCPDAEGFAAWDSQPICDQPGYPYGCGICVYCEYLAWIGESWPPTCNQPGYPYGCGICEYCEWRAWLCATGQCDGCHRCEEPWPLCVQPDYPYGCGICEHCEYIAWREEIVRAQAAYEEWRAWERAVAEAQAAYEEWRAWLEKIAQAEREYQEWRDWLCATSQCGECDRCEVAWRPPPPCDQPGRPYGCGRCEHCAYYEWRDWLCATGECGGCDRCRYYQMPDPWPPSCDQPGYPYGCNSCMYCEYLAWLNSIGPPHTPICDQPGSLYGCNKCYYCYLAWIEGPPERCEYQEYRAWREEVERARIAYEEYRAWLEKIAQAEREHQEWLAWLERECHHPPPAYQEYLAWREEVERARIAYEEWRDWLCATDQCDGCDRCD